MNEDGISEIKVFFNDIESCSLCDVGTKCKTKYKNDGSIEKVFETEDKFFQCQRNRGKFCLYGVIDGHNGHECAVSTKLLIADKLLQSLNENSNHKEIITALKKAFADVAQIYFTQVIGEKLSFLANAKDELKVIDENEAHQKHISLLASIERHEEEVSQGCTVAISLIANNSLYVANVGDVRVFLCRQDPADEGELIATQLSVDHTVTTNAELERFVGIGIEDLEPLQRIDSGIVTTRSIGDYKLQKEYKEIDALKTAKSQPIICEPDVHGGEAIKEQLKFMFIMSHGFYDMFLQTYRIKPDEVKTEVAHMINDRYLKNTNIKGIAQEIIEQVCRQFKEQHAREEFAIEDMTLLIRFFDHQLVKSTVPKQNVRSDISTRLSKVSMESGLSLKMPKDEPLDEDSTPSTTGNNTPVTTTPVNQPPSFNGGTPTTLAGTFEVNTTDSNPSDSPGTTGNENPIFPSVPDQNNTDNDEAAVKPIEPYVDFSEFFQKVNERGGEREVFKEFMF